MGFGQHCLDLLLWWFLVVLEQYHGHFLQQHGISWNKTQHQQETELRQENQIPTRCYKTKSRWKYFSLSQFNIWITWKGLYCWTLVVSLLNTLVQNLPRQLQHYCKAHDGHYNIHKDQNIFLLSIFHFFEVFELFPQQWSLQWAEGALWLQSWWASVKTHFAVSSDKGAHDREYDPSISWVFILNIWNYNPVPNL